MELQAPEKRRRQNSTLNMQSALFSHVDSWNSVAQSVQKPVFTMTCDEIGTEPNLAKTHLRETFRLTRKREMGELFLNEQQ